MFLCWRKHREVLYVTPPGRCVMRCPVGRAHLPFHKVKKIKSIKGQLLFLHRNVTKKKALKETFSVGGGETLDKVPKEMPV